MTLPLTGFPAEGLQFLSDLADHNEPAWFKPRRDAYEAHVRGPMVALVADLLTLAAAGDLPLTGEPEKAVFRVYRDVRFARDKRPYKTHCGASLSRTGAKLAPGLYVMAFGSNLNIETEVVCFYLDKRLQAHC